MSLATEPTRRTIDAYAELKAGTFLDDPEPANHWWRRPHDTAPPQLIPQKDHAYALEPGQADPAFRQLPANPAG